MKFIKIGIENFQKCKLLEFNFNAGITSIIGANGTGKTTILDAVKWVLFGRDFEGNARFDINRIATDGTVDASPVSVLLVIEQDGITHELQRGLFRGTTSCSVDGVPYKVSDYSAYVGKITDGEERFKLYSDPLYFFGLHWTAQRTSLMGYFPLPSDEIVFEGAAFGQTFKNKLAKLTPEQISLAASFAVKELSKRQNELTGQIKLLDEYCAKDVGDITSYERERDLVDKELAKTDSFLDGLWDVRERIANNKLKESVLKQELETIIRGEDDRRQEEKVLVMRRISDLMTSREVLRETLKGVYRTDTVCPTCKRPFSAEYSQKMDDALDAKKTTIKNESDMIDEELGCLEVELSDILTRNTYLTSVEELRISEIQKEREFIAITEETLPDTGEQIRSRNALSDRLNELNRLLARRDLLEENTARREVSKLQLRKVNEDREDSEFLARDADAFISRRTKIVVEQLNAKFKTIQIKLFNTLAGGEQKECFEITRNGVPFESLNTASKLEVGIELVEFLKEGMGVESPILIDNAERYVDVDFNRIKGQVVLAEAVKGSGLIIV